METALRIFSVLAGATAIALMFACGACKKQESTSQTQALIPDDHPRVDGQLCLFKLQQYNLDVSKYEAHESQRQQTCAALDEKQVNLNNAYEQLKHDSPATANVLISGIRKSNGQEPTDEDKQAMQAACLLVSLGDGDCVKTFNDIRFAAEQQRLLNNQVQMVCCPLGTRQDVYADLGLSFQPECTVPTRPDPPPAC